MSHSHTIAGSHVESPTHPELEGCRVFLTGVGNGPGEHVASSFARQRTRLVLHSTQNPSVAAQFADTLKLQASSLRLFAGQVSPDQAACERLARAALGAFGGLDIVVNLIGGAQFSNLPQNSSRELEDAVADDLRPAMVLSRAVADHARNSGQGAAIMHVCVTQAGQGAQFARYAMLKTALEAMTQDQARRWFSHDICVYAFVPGIGDEAFDETSEAGNVVQARSNFSSALSAILLNAAGGRSRWLNGVTVAIPA